MFEILVYLFENYLDANFHPDQDYLERELSAAGFNSDEISQAFAWLHELETLVKESSPPDFSSNGSLRCYHDRELKKINPESRGFLIFLETSHVITPVQREWIIDRIMALNIAEVSLEQVKWIVLLVLWRQGNVDDTLFLEELLLDESDTPFH